MAQAVAPHMAKAYGTRWYMVSAATVDGKAAAQAMLDAGKPQDIDFVGETVAGKLEQTTCLLSTRGPSSERGSSHMERTPSLFQAPEETKPRPYCYLTMTSTRRFFARPASVLLLATGLLSPWPAADKLVLTPPSRSARAAL